MSDVAAVLQNAGDVASVNSNASKMAEEINKNQPKLEGPAKDYFDIETALQGVQPEIEVPNTTGAKPKITLCMIVKNESKVIERCISSILPIIDHWVIVDTGSTDDTKEKIKNFMTVLNKPGKLYSRPWKHFAHNRTEALILARSEAEYTFMIDADEIVEYDANFDPDKFRAALTADLYNVFAFYGNTKYHRPQLTKNSIRYQYRGVLHEYVAAIDEIKTREFAPYILNKPIQDGARAGNPQKYQDDAKLLEETLAGKFGPVPESDYNRYVFYLAQSYRDSQQWEKSLENYLKRAGLGGWAEEVFFSLYQAGRIMEILTEKGSKEFTIDHIIGTYFRAYQAAPWRAETLWCAARLCRINCRFDQGYAFAKAASRIKYPEGALFVTQHVYDWGIWDELAVCSYWSGHYKDSVIANKNLLTEGKMPKEQAERIQTNYKLAFDLLMGE